ncbi:MAG: L-seryl-tRNA(Sec) selenium transferase, partial [Deltaproteobacteria bacterium]|nr:L-seryl-tRNA(Sec) selenium transferase [Deltaproteobacteria bacterium]
MNLKEKQQTLLRMLPAVDYILELAKADSFYDNVPKSVLVRSIRSVVEDLRMIIIDDRQDLTETDLSDANILKKIKNSAKRAMAPVLTRVINATGVVVHTNLGRSLLSDDAVQNLLAVASGYSNLEFDLSKGMRGSR